MPNVGMAATYGFEEKWCFSKTSTIDTGAKRFEIHPAGETLSRNESIINTGGTTGDVGIHVERNRGDAVVTAGTLNFHVSHLWLKFFLPLIIGNGAVVAGVYNFGNIIDPFWCMIHRKARVYKYLECYVSKATFKSRSSQYIDVALDILAVDGTSDAPGGALTFPAVTMDAADVAMLMKDIAFTQETLATTLLDFDLTIDNKLISRYGNSATPTDIQRSDNRQVTLNTNEPFNSVTAGQFYGALPNAGLAALLTFIGPSLTDDGTAASCAIAIPHWVIQNGDPTLASKGEMPLKFQGDCDRSISGNEFVATIVDPD